MERGELVKLIIQGYSNVKFDTKVGDKFKALINPEKISLSHKVEYNSKSADGTTGSTQKLIRFVPPELNLDILFDATGVVQNTINNDLTGDSSASNNSKSVTKQIKNFEEVTLNYKGQEHKPNHLWVNWGDINFKGVLQNYSIEYKLFNRDGSPIRAVAKIKLSEAKAEGNRAAEENKSSPDLTHIRQVVDGNTLPKMCEEIYGDSKYYLEVAKANNISNFRKLIPGQRINFPPIEKNN